MSIRKKYLSAVLFFMALGSTLAQGGRDELVQMQGQLQAWWLVSVEGDSRPRAMQILSIAAQPAGGYLGEITYGWADGSQGPLQAEIRIDGGKRLLSFVTQANSRISAYQSSDSTFEGTFTPRQGNAKPIKLTRLSADEFRLKRESLLAQKTAPPGPQTPDACAKFHGGWSGSWPSLGPSRLWVVGITSDCRAQVSYTSGSSNEVPSSFFSADIRQGVLTLKCGMGKCIFEQKGNDMWAVYSGDGFSASAVFVRMK